MYLEFIFNLLIVNIKVGRNINVLINLDVVNESKEIYI